MNFDNKIKRMLGTTKKFGGRNDWDGDGVPNKRDCQPRNTMRQDYASGWWDRGHKVRIEESLLSTNPIWVSYRLYVDGIHIDGAEGIDTTKSLKDATIKLRNIARAHITELEKSK